MEKDLFELTNPQKSIWYTENYFENTNINNICTSGIIYENINIEALKKAINFLVQNNDSFRIQLSLKNDVPMQYISDFVPFEIETIYVDNMVDFNNIIAIKFISTDQIINGFQMVCLKSNVFAEIEEKLYKFYPAYRETNNTFLYNGNSILRFKTLAENKIENGIPITLYNNFI